MAKEIVNVLDDEKELEEIKSRVNKYYQKLVSDYDYHKAMYVEAINKNLNNIRYETNYNYSKKAVDNCKYYLYKYLESSENIDTEVNDDELPWEE